MTETVLITGGTGFIGSHLAAQLVDRGHEVVAFDRDGDTKLLDRLGVADDVSIRTGDVSDPTDVFRAVARSGATRIVHLAALLSASNVELPTRTAVNVDGAGTVLEAARILDDRVDRVVLASSETVYAPDSAYPHDEVPEDVTLQPESPYAAAKLYAERLAYAYADEHGLSTAVIRPTGVFGAGGHGIEFSDLFERAARGEPVRVGPADGTISWLYVRDAASAFAALALADEGDLSQRVYNVRGEYATVAEVAETVRSATDAPITVEDGDPLEWSAQRTDVSAARRDLGYEIEWPIERFVPEYIEHERSW